MSAEEIGKFDLTNAFDSKLPERRLKHLIKWQGTSSHGKNTQGQFPSFRSGKE